VKVLVLSNLYPPDVIGGYEVACGQVVDGLLARGHDVRVLTAAPRQPIADDAPHVRRHFRLADEWNENVMGPFPVQHLLTHAHSRFIDAHNVYVLVRELEAFAPDVVYLGNLVGVGGLGLVGCLHHLSVPWAWQLGDCTPARLCSSRTGVIPALAGEYNRKVRGHYIAVSDGVRRETEGLGVRLEGQVALIPYWITGPRPPARADFYRPGHGPLRIISAGSVNRDKGVEVLIEAAHRLLGMGVDRFLVDVYGKVGDPSLVEMVHALGLDRHVTFQGPRPHRELMEIYGRYDVFAFPTNEREPFGLVPLEAASRGCVPVITRRCGVAEWMVHGVHCLKAERSADSFAGALRDVALGETCLEPLARRASEAAWSDFHLDHVLPRIEGVLWEASARPRVGAGSPSEAYRLARLAEPLAEGLIQEMTADDVRDGRIQVGEVCV
jgi:glycosyltransferase involved in cell wall biosynthesis